MKQTKPEISIMLGLDLLKKREYNLMAYEGLDMAHFYKTKKRSKHGR